MQKKSNFQKISFFLLTCSVLFLSCEPTIKPGFRLSLTTLPLTYRFSAIQMDSNQKQSYTYVTADLVKTTDHLAIYQKQGQDMSQADVEYLADNFEAHYDNLINIYGTHTDLDNNGKVIVLLYDINKNYKKGDSYVAGFFNSADMIKEYFTSNKGEILYMESQVSGDIENIFGTVVHEFQHLINYNMNFNQNNGIHSDLWLNESLSCSAEIYVQDALQGHRMDTYNSATYGQAIKKGNYFYHWNDDDYVLCDYSTASLFMYWLYLHGNKKEILHDIAHASKINRGKHKSIVEATEKTVSTSLLHNLTSWQDILFSWIEANENNGYPNGQYWTIDENNEIVKGNIELASKVLTTSGDINLNPGDMLVTANKTSSTEAKIVHSTFSTNSSIHITLNAETQLGTNSLEVSLSDVASMAHTRSAFTYTEGEPVYPDYKIIPMPPIQIGNNYD